jgi:hypothetical protein
MRHIFTLSSPHFRYRVRTDAKSLHRHGLVFGIVPEIPFSGQRCLQSGIPKLTWIFLTGGHSDPDIGGVRINTLRKNTESCRRHLLYDIAPRLMSRQRYFRRTLSMAPENIGIQQCIGAARAENPLEQSPRRVTRAAMLNRIQRRIRSPSAPSSQEPRLIL